MIAESNSELVEVMVEDDFIKGKWTSVVGYFHAYLVVDREPGIVVKVNGKPRWTPFFYVTFVDEQKHDKLKSQGSRRRTRTSQPTKGARTNRPKRATVLRG